jgi:hypothetical protein
MLLKKSPHAVTAPQAKISTSQIGLQAARESWLGVKRPMKTSRNSSAPTFSTVSRYNGHSLGQIDRHVVGQTCRSRRRDNGHSAMAARTNRTGAIDKGCAMPALSRMHVSAPVSQRAGVAQASMEENQSP